MDPQIMETASWIFKSWSGPPLFWPTPWIQAKRRGHIMSKHTMPYCTIVYSIPFYSTPLCYVILYYTKYFILYYIVLYHIVQLSPLGWPQEWIGRAPSAKRRGAQSCRRSTGRLYIQIHISLSNIIYVYIHYIYGIIVIQIHIICIYIYTHIYVVLETCQQVCNSLECMSLTRRRTCFLGHRSLQEQLGYLRG